MTVAPARHCAMGMVASAGQVLLRYRRIQPKSLGDPPRWLPHRLPTTELSYPYRRVSPRQATRRGKGAHERYIQLREWRVSPRLYHLRAPERARELEGPLDRRRLRLP